MGKVAHTAQQGIGYTGRATAAAGNLVGCLIVARHAKDVGRARDDACEHLIVVILEVHVDAEASAQRRCEHTATCGSTYECEGVEVNLYASCRRTLVDHDIDTVVLHSRVEVLLHHGRQTVYLINE